MDAINSLQLKDLPEEIILKILLLVRLRHWTRMRAVDKWWFEFINGRTYPHLENISIDTIYYPQHMNNSQNYAFRMYNFCRPSGLDVWADTSPANYFREIIDMTSTTKLNSFLLYMQQSRMNGIVSHFATNASNDSFLTSKLIEFNRLFPNLRHLSVRSINTNKDAVSHRPLPIDLMRRFNFIEELTVQIRFENEWTLCTINGIKSCFPLDRLTLKGGGQIGTNGFTYFEMLPTRLLKSINVNFFTVINNSLENTFSQYWARGLLEQLSGDIATSNMIWLRPCEERLDQLHSKLKAFGGGKCPNDESDWVKFYKRFKNLTRLKFTAGMTPTQIRTAVIHATKAITIYLPNAPTWEEICEETDMVAINIEKYKRNGYGLLCQKLEIQIVKIVNPHGTIITLELAQKFGDFGNLNLNHF